MDEILEFIYKYYLLPKPENFDMNIGLMKEEKF